MPRPLRVLAAVAVLVMTITACQKPLPELTVLSGSTTTTVQPQTYCFDPSHCHFPKSVVAGVSARAGSTLLVDVPHAVAAQTWSVLSAVRTAKGVFKSIKGANYRADAVTNSHSTEIHVPYGVGSYYLIVSQRGTATVGSWVAEIMIHS